MKEILPLISDAFTERDYVEVYDNVSLLRFAMDDIQQSIQKLEAKQTNLESSQTTGFDTCATTLNKFREGITTLLQQVQKDFDSMKEVNAGTRLENLEKSVESFSESTKGFRTQLEELLRNVRTSPSRQLENDVTEIRNKLDTHLSSIELNRSKPTTPNTVQFPATPPLDISTSRSTQSVTLDSAQRQEIISFVLQSVHTVLANLDASLRSEFKRVCEEMSRKIGDVDSNVAHTKE
jgi:hypothetical protein